MGRFCILISLFFVFLCHQSLISSTHFFELSKAEAKSKKKKKKYKKSKKDILDSSFVKKIHRRQGRRLERLNSYKKRGLIGENLKGLLSIRSKKGLSKKQLIKFEKLVKKENSDREKLYAVIIKANKYNKKEKENLRKSMFETRLEMDPIGTYYYQDRYWLKK